MLDDQNDEVPKLVEMEPKRTKDGFYLAEPDEMIDLGQKKKEKRKRKRRNSECSEEEVLENVRPTDGLSQNKTVGK